jgi:peptidylamidoglycolate lyase
VSHGLTVDSQDNVWVTDTGLHQVFKFSHNGELLMTVGAKGVPGLDGTHLNKPTDVVVAPTGEFYVSSELIHGRVEQHGGQCCEQVRQIRRRHSGASGVI